ncbi:hypothetical protein ACHAXM_011644 [Skeletonema potamos]|jgi:hypothetical protein
MKTTNNAKRGRCGAANKAVSAAVMGKALAAILATSCAGFQTSPTACRIGAGCSGLLRTHDQHCTVALHYRYGGDTDQMPIRMQAATSDSVEMTDLQSGRRIVSLPQLTFLRRPVDDDQQSVMDDYLEYVDRRYSRIHETTLGSSSRRRRQVVLDFQLPRKIFFATLALHQRGQNTSATTGATASTATMVTTKSPQALAELNALGLSDLASARLRQRLQAPRDLRDEFTAASYLLDHLPSPSFEAALATHMQRASPAPAPVVAGSTTMVAQPAVGGRISSFANVGPVAQYQLLVQTLRKFLQAFITSIKIIGNFASRVIPEILEKGGFRHSVRMMSVATVALLFMFKPLFRGAMKG